MPVKGPINLLTFTDIRAIIVLELLEKYFCSYRFPFWRESGPNS
jgi:hypothetical protein